MCPARTSPLSPPHRSLHASLYRRLGRNVMPRRRLAAPPRRLSPTHQLLVPRPLHRIKYGSSWPRMGGA
ncbi:hypothetical protein GUJ93_ZPchr0001g32265 [Zizania palustris]|uniref:Uncharacterized protein n=1 Tax=Zizania palustris TaxID=103762 RepID=A0A8J5SB94_ZIZPA|nr:hypothetical protein GUJ93_ZPchr0001g32265 [Zizania palustris]